jgi:hypothetical protein
MSRKEHVTEYGEIECSYEDKQLFPDLRNVILTGPD